MEIKNIILLVVFILGLVFMQFIQAQSVDEIIDNYAEARGGKHKINSINSIYMQGIREMMGNAVAVKVIKVQGKLFRNDFEFRGTSGYTIVTPSAGWSFIPMRSQKPEPLAGERLTALQSDLDIACPLLNYAAKGNKAVLIGKEDVDGKQAYKIKLTLNSGKEIIYFIDTKTHLVIQTKQMTVSMHAGGNANAGQERELITNFSDYRSVEGILFPYKVSNPGSGPGTGSTAFSKIELNKTIDENQYRPSV
ncbi:MAG: hypothetical protein H0V14_06940 [Chitinophagaceae bacterium]|nr:hypothetical protein [Chitinophagaceae bacterium]